jgi:uncharacterized protein DUF6894
MPHFSFLTTHNGKVVESDEPINLPDVEAAWHEATVHAGQMLKDLDGKLNSNTEWSVEIRENGESIRAIRIVTEGKK